MTLNYEHEGFPIAKIVREDYKIVVVSTIDFNIMLFKDYYNLLQSFCKEGNLKNIMGQNAIIIATYYCHLNLVRYLVEIRADLDSTSNNGATLLMLVLNHCEKTNNQCFLLSLLAQNLPGPIR